MQANGQLDAGRKSDSKQPAIEVQAKETLDHAKELAGAAMKAATGKGLSVDSQKAVQSSELSKKGSLTPAEEALLNEMIQKNGNLAAQKKAAQMTGFVNGEPLTRREGIGAVKSMTAKEGEILKNLSGGEEAEAPKKLKAGKSARTQQPFGDARHSRRRGKGGTCRSVGGCDEAGIRRSGPGPAGTSWLQRVR